MGEPVPVQLLLEREDWMKLSACRGMSTELFTTTDDNGGTRAPRLLLELCAQCRVFDQCDEHARRTKASGIFQAGAFRQHGRPRRQPEPLVDLGFSARQAHQARLLAAESTGSGFELGDLLVDVFGLPSAPGVMDGSRGRLHAAADHLGLSLSWLVACRIAAAAWNPDDRRPGVSWVVYRTLSARPNRVELLGAFIDHCRRRNQRPNLIHLRPFLSAQERDDPVEQEDQCRPGRPGRPGRPRIPAVERAYQAAVALDTEALRQLVERLNDALAERLQTAVA